MCFTRKASTEERSEMVDRDLEKDRPSISSSPEVNSDTYLVGRPTMLKPDWWGPKDVSTSRKMHDFCHA